MKKLIAMLVASVAVVGTGAAAAPAAQGPLSADTHVLSFGHQAVGTREVQTFSITNTTSESVALRYFAPSEGYGVPGGTCGAASEAPAILAPGGSCTLVVQFWPQEIGRFFGSLSIYGQGPDPLLEVKLHGFSV